MITSKTKADGFFKVSAGQAQIQLRSTSEVIGVLHSETIPTGNEAVDFVINGGGIEISLGTLPCYVKVISYGKATFAYEDISV